MRRFKKLRHLALAGCRLLCLCLIPSHLLSVLRPIPLSKALCLHFLFALQSYRPGRPVAKKSPVCISKYSILQISACFCKFQNSFSQICIIKNIQLHLQPNYISKPIFSDMDIVSRLKVFMDAKRIPVTQFADNCRIPRPSMSQLLSGRNKKVSDEVITKIHDAYPDLSVLWLMFGEGDMESRAKNEISEPQIPAQNHAFSEQALNFQPIERRIDFDMDDTEENAEKTARNRDADVTHEAKFPAPEMPRRAPSPTSPAAPDDDDEAPRRRPTDSTSATATGSPTTLTLHTDDKQGKRVIGIVVYYNDNSYESFVPDNSGKAPF